MLISLILCVIAFAVNVVTDSSSIDTITGVFERFR